MFSRMDEWTYTDVWLSKFPCGHMNQNRRFSTGSNDMHGSTSSTSIFQIHFFFIQILYFLFIGSKIPSNYNKINTTKTSRLSLWKSVHSGPDWCDLWYHFQLCLFSYFFVDDSILCNFKIARQRPEIYIYICIYFILSSYKQTAWQNSWFRKRDDTRRINEGNPNK